MGSCRAVSCPLILLTCSTQSGILQESATFARNRLSVAPAMINVGTWHRDISSIFRNAMMERCDLQEEQQEQRKEELAQRQVCMIHMNSTFTRFTLFYLNPIFLADPCDHSRTILKERKCVTGPPFTENHTPFHGFLFVLPFGVGIVVCQVCPCLGWIWISHWYTVGRHGCE